MFLNYKTLLFVVLSAFIIVGSSGFYRFSKKDDLAISIINNTSGYQFRVDIGRSAHQIKIVYALLDSVKSKGLENDTAYVKMREQFMKKLSARFEKDTLEKYINQLEEIRQRYCVYSRDSILLDPKVDTSYNNLLTRISIANITELENKAVNKNRIVLDGIGYNYKIRLGQVSRSFYATSPSAVSHPLLYALMHQSFAVYRDKKGDAFLTKKRTDWY
jgi:hypothetical protein